MVLIALITLSIFMLQGSLPISKHEAPIIIEPQTHVHSFAKPPVPLDESSYESALGFGSLLPFLLSGEYVASPTIIREDPHAIIDRILGTLEFGNIAFNTPKTMNIKDKAIIQLVLGLEAEIEELKQMIKIVGEKEGARIKVHPRMKAHLSGVEFNIEPADPQIQAVSRNAITKWEWEIKPKSIGRHSLHLKLFVLLKIDGESTPREIETFNKVIEVEVTIPQKIILFLEKYLDWLWFAIFIPMAGWLLNRRRRS